MRLLSIAQQVKDVRALNIVGLPDMWDAVTTESNDPIRVMTPFELLEFANRIKGLLDLLPAPPAYQMVPPGADRRQRVAAADAYLAEAEGDESKMEFKMVKQKRAGKRFDSKRIGDGAEGMLAGLCSKLYELKYFIELDGHDMKSSTPSSALLFASAACRIVELGLTDSSAGRWGEFLAGVLSMIDFPQNLRPLNEQRVLPTAQAPD